MTKYQCDVEDFLKSIENHRMEVISDNGVNRVLKFSRNNSSVYHFYITTWHNHLCISGDVGTFVFSRLNDMFEFFRSYSKELEINPSYWSEKLQAIEKHSGYEKFNPDTFDSNVLNYLEDSGIDKDHSDYEAVIENLEYGGRILNRHFDNEHNALDAIYNYICPVTGIDFSDFAYVGYNNEEYTYHYIWCLYAIVWAIKKYDEGKQNVNCQ